MEAMTHRIQLALTPQAYKTLNGFKRVMGASSVTEVVRGALATIQWLRDRANEGYEIVLIKDGQVLPITRLLPVPLISDPAEDESGTAQEQSAGTVG